MKKKSAHTGSFAGSLVSGQDDLAAVTVVDEHVAVHLYLHLHT